MEGPLHDLNPIRCQYDRHGEAIRAIFNDAILHSTALYDYRPREAETIMAWFKAKAAGGYPVLGLETPEGELMGFASFGPFRAFPAYKYTVEHSVYVAGRFRQRGVARKLMLALIEAAQRADYHMMIGGIDASNSASVALHKSLGFTQCASIRQAGFKFGRWLDLEFYQLILPTPAQPVDG
jgi:L-amino acid N-acyltransferase